MTTIITRLYPTQSAANAARASLLEKGQNEDTIQIILGGNAEEAAAALATVSVHSLVYTMAAFACAVALLALRPINRIAAQAAA